MNQLLHISIPVNLHSHSKPQNLTPPPQKNTTFGLSLIQNPNQISTDKNSLRYTKSATQQHHSGKKSYLPETFDREGKKPFFHTTKKRISSKQKIVRNNRCSSSRKEEDKFFFPLRPLPYARAMSTTRL